MNMLFTNLYLTQETNPQLHPLIQNIQKQGFSTKSVFHRCLVQALDIVISDWNLSIYDEFCYGDVHYNATDIANLIIFGSEYDLSMARSITVKNRFLDGKFNKHFYQCLHEIVTAICFRVLHNEDFLKGFNNKFSEFSIEEIGKAFCLEAYFSKAS